jgi:hypothetical protein
MEKNATMSKDLQGGIAVMNQTFENENENDVEKLLLGGRRIQIPIDGYSMYPMLVPGRDEAVIEQADVSLLKRGDVVLYRRLQGILVLHRIWRVKGDGFYMVGDNQMELEGPLDKDQIHGRLVAIVRNGKRISVTNPFYLFYSRTWLFLRPCRHRIALFVHMFCKTN